MAWETKHTVAHLDYNGLQRIKVKVQTAADMTVSSVAFMQLIKLVVVGMQ